MTRKPRVPKSTGKPVKRELPALQMVPISCLRLRIEQEEGLQVSFDESRYAMRDLKEISSEVIALLLELHPLAVIRKEKHFEVIAGARLFKIAAFCLDPSAVIPVLVVDKRFASGNKDLLRYLDLAVVPLIHTLRGSALELYQIFNGTGLRKEVWLPPLDKSAISFARALGVKPSALSSPATDIQKKRMREVSSSSPSEKP